MSVNFSIFRIGAFFNTGVITSHSKKTLAVVVSLWGVIVSASAFANGLILMDGSSTVYPISAQVAQDFYRAESGQTKVLVGISGTGGGFKKFCQGELDMSNASRAISFKEKALCQKNGIEYFELPIALDAITVVVNKDNDWASTLSVEQLKRVWQADSEGKVTNWRQVDSGFPQRPLTLYGPGADSGTYDYFIDAIVNTQRSRLDYYASEDDEVLAQKVAQDSNAMAFFGLAYYLEHQDTLKAVAISNSGNKPVTPSLKTLKQGDYQPLSRPLYVYVNKQSVEDFPFVDRFVHYFFHPKRLIHYIKEAGYVPLSEPEYQNILRHYSLGEPLSIGDEGRSSLSR